MEEWKEYKLGEVLCDKGYIRGPFGSSLKRGDLLCEGIPVYEQQHAIYNKRDFRFYISEDKYNEMKRFTVYPNDIIISCSGTVGEVSLIKKEDPKGIISQALLLLRSNVNIILPEFLLYFFRTSKGHNSITSRSSGSVQVNIARREVIEGIPLLLPDIESQQKIVSVLKSLDDKIEVNRRINENLEAQAQALFKSWFVDFDPFKEGEFIESELGQIPKGWRVGNLGEITTQLSNKVGQEQMKVMSPVTSGKLMLSEEYFSKQVFSDSIAKYKIVEIGNFAYNPARVNIGSLGRNDYNYKGCVSPVYVVFSCIDGFSDYFDLFRKTERFQNDVKSRAIGGVRQTLNYSDFCLIKTVIAPQNVLNSFNTLYNPIFSLQKHIENENTTLVELRDTLLPRLMSGELKVNDIDINI